MQLLRREQTRCVLHAALTTLLLLHMLTALSSPISILLFLPPSSPSFFPPLATLTVRQAENQLSLLRSRIASLEEDLKKEQQRRRDEIDELHRSKELAVEELEARQRELTDAVEEVKEQG